MKMKKLINTFMFQMKRNLYINSKYQNNNNQSLNSSSSKLKFYESSRQFKEVNINQFESLFKNNDENKNKIKDIINIYELEKYTTQHVPTNLTMDNMKNLLSTYDDEKELRKMIKFLYIRECDKFNTYKKRFYRKQEIKEKKIEKYGYENTEWENGVFDEKGEIVYGLWHNSLISRITKQSIRNYRNIHVLRNACLYGQKLIVDCDYDKYMKPSEIGLLAKQISIMFYDNLINRDYSYCFPYDIHFTNCQNGKSTIKELYRHIRRMDELKNYYFHNESYLNLPDLFPKQRLVYLSPHAKQSLKQYNHDDIYILGGYNDRSSHQQISHVKAQSEGIRCYRLPLDENVLWKQGDKNLCLNQVLSILHAVKATGNWQLAIRKFAPQRKVRSLEEQHLEDMIRIKAVTKRIKLMQRNNDYN